MGPGSRPLRLFPGSFDWTEMSFNPWTQLRGLSSALTQKVHDMVGKCHRLASGDDLDYPSSERSRGFEPQNGHTVGVGKVQPVDRKVALRRPKNRILGSKMGSSSRFLTAESGHMNLEIGWF
ncbi:MAG: hypothetical protein ACKVVP_24015 [Chloroflexota bacterium]